MRSNGIALVVFCAVVVVSGCHKRAKVTALPPAAAAPVPAPVAPAPAPPPPDPVPAAPAPVVVSAFDQAERAFASGNYEEAARAYENYLKTTSANGQRDQALFHLGLTYALRGTSGSDWQRAAATFKQLIDEYPNSPHRPPASLILSLHADLDQTAADSKQRDQRIKQLTTELDRLKKIDADRRRRP